MKWFHQKFPKYQHLLASGKVLFWLTILNAVSWLSWLFVDWQALTWFNLAVVFVLGLLASYSAWAALNYSEKGFRLMMLLYAVGLVQIRTAGGFYLDLTGATKLTLGFSMEDNFFAVNFLAIVLIAYASKNAAWISRHPWAEQSQVHASDTDH